MIEVALKTKNEMTYDAALLYCQFLDYNGYKDWRLPTYDEWNHTDDMEWCWYINRNTIKYSVWRVFPVRDVLE